MLRAQIIPVGDAIGIALPEAVVKHLGLSIDDTLVIVQTAIGFEFWPEEPDPLE
jgi:antitoxin component of MazEF toxin-antitoxin module